jgi:nicotinamidase-related amidase
MANSRIDPSDTVVLFADLQDGIADLPLTVSAESLRKSVKGLAKLAKIFNLPVFVTAVSPDGSPAKLMPELAEVLGDFTVHYRMTADSFRNEAIVDAIRATGRKTVLISGVATELAVQLPAVTGPSLGFRTYAVVDACGGSNARTEQAALTRIVASGGNVVSVLTLAGELSGEFTSPEAQQAIPIVFEMASP